MFYSILILIVALAVQTGMLHSLIRSDARRVRANALIDPGLAGGSANLRWKTSVVICDC